MAFTNASKGAVPTPWNILAQRRLAWLREAPPHALDPISRTVPRRNKCLLPQILADGTANMPATPTPRRKYPVSSAICVNFVLKNRDSVRVLAASMGPRDVAKTEVRDRITRIASRFHKGQF